MRPERFSTDASVFVDAETGQPIDGSAQTDGQKEMLENPLPQEPDSEDENED